MRVLLSIALTVALCWIVVRGLELIAPLHRAWTPSDFATVGGRADTWALASVRDDPRWCRSVLAAAHVQFTPMPDRVTGPGCGFKGAVRLTGPELSPRGPVLTCPLAVALTLWERRVVRPAARAGLGSDIAALEHFGTYSCRAIAGSDRRSQHATANAIDIAGFRLKRGGMVSVRRDWKGEPARAQFLHDTHDGGCRLFGTVLGPGYNAAHRDHLHLDMANWSYCP
ncbi:extensin family protein [Sphingosinicellaceae bacterium]|nr:extensin family protein [Sphingosinicellaceae bacterium]